MYNTHRDNSLAVLAMSLLLGVPMLALNIKPISAEPYGCVDVTVRYQDGCPRSDAIVKTVDPPYPIGVTNESGIAIDCSGYLGEGVYLFKAYWPDSVTLFAGPGPLVVDSNGTGSATLTANYNEDIPPAIEILSPQNQTYTTSSVPLNFTIDDYSPISWTGYSLDNQPNVTITGNTTLSSLTLGKHNIIVYSNDTYGNMGASNKIYFTREYGCVTIKVQYQDGNPRFDADVFYYNNTLHSWEPFGTTNESGLTTQCDWLLPNTIYSFRAYWPPGTDFGPWIDVETDGDGNGYGIIQESYEVMPPVIIILSPQNTTYTTSSVPLTFIYDDYSEPSWIGYSLDNNPNVTISGNTTISVGLGQHNVVVYANDTYGNLGSSDKVYFTKIGCVTIRVQYADGYPRSDAFVLWRNTTEWQMFGKTDDKGVVIKCNYLAPGVYQASAWYPDLGTQFGEDTPFVVNATGDGSTTITADYPAPLVTVTVLFADDYPVEGAQVAVFNATDPIFLGYTNAGGQVERCDLLSPGDYMAKAYYPPPNYPWFQESYLHVDQYGNGRTTISGTYETTPPAIEILSPENKTYTSTTVPLTFTFDDYSMVSWMGYSLDGAANATIAGNTTLTDLAPGSHNIVIYANDTYANMGNSTKVYFTKDKPVGGLWVPVNKLGLLAPYIGLASTIVVATVAAFIYVKRVKSRKEKQ